MRIGYYAHHHGSGHCRQADKLAALLNKQGLLAEHYLTVFTSVSPTDYVFEHLAADSVVRLAAEDERSDDLLPGRAGQYWQPSSLHYSPVGNPDIQSRSLKLLNEISRQQIELMIIDLSVEVALLCRAASIPYLYVRLPGDRNDDPHINAFTGAIGLLAAYPRCLEAPSTPDWVKQKTLYLGFLSASVNQPSPYYGEPTNHLPALSDKGRTNDNQLASRSKLIQSLQDSATNPLNKVVKQQVIATLFDKLQQAPLLITVIKGFGGHQLIDQQLAALRQAFPNAFIISLGPIGTVAATWVDIATQVADVTAFLQHSDLLVMACGLNAIAEACQVSTPLIVIPDERPHREQEMMAEGLIACGRAIRLSTLINRHGRIQNQGQIGSQGLPELFRPSTELQAELQSSNADNFMVSLACAADAKHWFYSWLLPQLQIAPEKMIK